MTQLSIVSASVGAANATLAIALPNTPLAQMSVPGGVVATSIETIRPHQNQPKTTG
jgi:hypothetical protein